MHAKSTELELIPVRMPSGQDLYFSPMEIQQFAAAAQAQKAASQPKAVYRTPSTYTAPAMSSSLINERNRFIGQVLLLFGVGLGLLAFHRTALTRTQSEAFAAGKATGIAESVTQVQQAQAAQFAAEAQAKSAQAQIQQALSVLGSQPIPVAQPVQALQVAQ